MIKIDIFVVFVERQQLFFINLYKLITANKLKISDREKNLVILYTDDRYILIFLIEEQKATWFWYAFRYF